MNKLLRLFALVTCSALVAGCTVSPTEPTAPTEAPPTQAKGASLTVDLGNTTPISENLFGLFLEDINYAVDAGLYAELLRNRSFEYGSLAINGAKHGWSTTDDTVTFEIATESPLNENNPTYAHLENSGTPEGIKGTGYLDGLAVEGGKNYTASFFARGTASVTVSIESADGVVYASADLAAASSDWNQYSVTLTPSETSSNKVRFALRLTGTLDVDMISLMPEDTFRGLPIRKDLGEALAALNPSFLRFPGGCVVEGKTPESIYNWKNSVGGGIPFTVNGENAVGHPATRPQVVDIWNGTQQNPYYCTYGLGFYEYFQLCEALDCIPLPILNAGMTCQIQSPKYIVYSTSSPEFQQFVQDALDLVEFCRGGADTVWGSVRIAMGHPEPFALHYIGIGNEQWQSEYHAHFEEFVLAFESAAKKNPDLYGGIELIVANGPSSGSTEGWGYIEDIPDSITTLVDEHYYEPPAWFLTNTHRYDTYPRDVQAKVFLGEYAAQSNTMGAALAEAAYMTALERNGDVVAMACYAPLFGNAAQNQWTPDMIFFNRMGHYLTPNYYVQQLFAVNAGSEYVANQFTPAATGEDKGLRGGIGLGSWMTSVSYDDLKVVGQDGSTLYENDFSGQLEDKWKLHTGTWAVKDGKLTQSATAAPRDDITGDAIYLPGDFDNYTMTVDATVLSGSEGFLIPVAFQDEDNHIFWNIGGWGNTVSCLQTVTDGAKSGQVSGTVKSVKLNKNQTYHLKVEVSGNSLRCYIDDVLYVDYTKQAAQSSYASVVRTEDALILKLVNVTGQSIPVRTAIPGLADTTAQVTTLSATGSNVVNSFNQPDMVAPREGTLAVSAQFTVELPAYSLTVVRIPQ